MANKETIEKLKELLFMTGYKEALDLAIKAIKNERPKGKWIKEDKPWGGFGDRVLVNTCSECGESFVYHGDNPKFCPNCGADMRGGQDNDPN